MGSWRTWEDEDYEHGRQEEYMRQREYQERQRQEELEYERHMCASINHDPANALEDDHVVVHSCHCGENQIEVFFS